MCSLNRFRLIRGTRMRISVVSLLLLAGCMVGPRYETPQVALTPSFVEPNDTKGELVDLKTWWQQFKDPILDEMVTEAIENNYDLQIAAEKIEEVRARYNLASANLWPEIDLNASFMREKLSQNICGIDPSFCAPVQNFYQFWFDATWEIDLFGRLRSLKNQALYELEASQENLRNVYISLLAELTRTYSSLRSTQQLIAITQSQIRFQEELLGLSEVRYKAGLKSEIEPLQSKALLDSLNASLPPLEAQKNISLYNIAVLLGRKPEEIPENWIFPMPIPEAKGKIPVGVPSDLIRRRPDIRKAERELAAANANVGANIALLFPTFSITGSFYGYQTSQMGTLLDNGSKNWSLAPNLFWPVIDFGRIRAQIDFSKAIEREALLNYEQTVLKALQEVEDSLVAYTKEERRLKKLEEQLSDVKMSRDLIYALYKAGLRSLTELLDAEEQILNVEQTVVLSQQTLSQDLISVYKSLGGEW